MPIFDTIQNFLLNASPIVTVLIALLTVAVAMTAAFAQTREMYAKPTRAEKAPRQEGAIGIEQQPGTKVVTTEILSPAERQYRLLSQYHSEGLTQSKISFWFSLIFAALGFIVIITAIFTMDKGVQFTEQGRAFITLLAGTIIDAVSALFFVQSNKARELMTNFFDRLRADRKLEEALNLCKEMRDKSIQSGVQTLLALKFAEVQFNDSLLTTLLGHQILDTVGTPRTNEPQSTKPETAAETPSKSD